MLYTDDFRKSVHIAGSLRLAEGAGGRRYLGRWIRGTPSGFRDARNAISGASAMAEIPSIGASAMPEYCP